MLKLIGVLIVIAGFMLKLDTIAVLIVAGIVTGFDPFGKEKVNPALEIDEDIVKIGGEVC